MSNKLEDEKASRFTVTEKAMRPASDKRVCFYCDQPIGGAHRSDCVLVVKKVKVRMLVEYEVEVPSFWEKHQVEFHRNDGSWCASNAVDELGTAFCSDDGPCMCGSSTFEYLGGDSDAYLSEHS